jgi:hypothetical protein
LGGLFFQQVFRIRKPSVEAEGFLHNSKRV